MKLKTEATAMPEIFPIFPKTISVIPEEERNLKATEATPTWIKPLTRVTRKNFRNSIPACPFSDFSNAQYLSATYFTTVAITKEIATNNGYFNPLSLDDMPNSFIKILRIIRSNMAKKAPIKRNFAN